MRRDSLSEATRSGLCFLQWGDALSGRQVVVCSRSLSSVGISIHEKCWYVCVIEMCLRKQVLCTYFW